MALYKVIISYDGTDFCGFQRQKNGRSIQGEMESTLKELGWKERSIWFAGRTDAGVHAEGQVISFQLDWQHKDIELIKALNKYLPDDISVKEVQQTHAGFHPRYDAKARIYRYQIYGGQSRDALLDRFYWRVWPIPDEDLMIESVKGILGTHDFRRLGCDVNGGDGVQKRTVDSAEWQFLEDHRFFLRIRAQSFLYHMVRRIVFLLIRIGQKKIEPFDLNKGLDFSKLPAGIAPAKGLVLEKVIY